MVDIVYVVKEADTNEELRYSLRSLQNLPHGQVWIVGHKPQWVTGVEHLPTRQSATKYENSTANLLTACAHGDVSDSFVYMNDDFFILTRLEEVPVLHRGPVEKVLGHYAGKGKQGSKYVRGMAETADVLKQWGHDDPISYELHLPMTISKQGMLDAVRRLGKERRTITALHKRTLYGNVAGLGGRQTADCKIFNGGQKLFPGWQFVSTTDRTFTMGLIGRQLRKKFPNPSPYEAS